jgi:predicted GNAT family acetyltransferase
MTETAAPAIARTPSRFELKVGNHIAFINYSAEGAGVLAFTHTEVPPALREGGIGTRLVLGALDQLRAAGLKVRPRCGFVRHVIARHPDYADLVA